MPYFKETERIVNISKLEKMLQSARLDLIVIQKKAESEGNTELTAALQKVQEKLLKCENFEFLLERRKVRDSQSS